MTQSLVMDLKPKLLEGRVVRLEPLADRHLDALRTACDADPDIWPLYSVNMSGAAFDAWWKDVQRRTEAGAVIPYAILVQGEVVGCSLLSIDAPNRRLEIGNTYLHPKVRGGPVNPDAKGVMLAHGFDGGARCIRFNVDVLNARSRAAVLKLGARQDGILRADRITWTGRVRDTVVFSILADEWPAVRARLEARLAAFG